MNSEDGQVYSIVYCNFLVALGTTIMQSKHKQTNCKHSRRKSYGLQLKFSKSKNYSKRRYRIIEKDDTEFVTEFPCLLGHPVQNFLYKRKLKTILIFLL